MKLAAFLVAAALLAAGVAAEKYTQPAYGLRPNVTTNRFTGKTVATNTFSAFINLPRVMAAGNFSVRPVGGATPKRELTVGMRGWHGGGGVRGLGGSARQEEGARAAPCRPSGAGHGRAPPRRGADPQHQTSQPPPTPPRKNQSDEVGCLNTVIPPPLNWGPLYCPGREVKVHQWFDDVGALHRTFDIPAQPNVTANMVFWLFSPSFPQKLEFAGKQWYWYHLWHPLDHIQVRRPRTAYRTAARARPGLRAPRTARAPQRAPQTARAGLRAAAAPAPAAHRALQMPSPPPHPPRPPTPCPPPASTSASPASTASSTSITATSPARPARSSSRPMSGSTSRTWHPTILRSAWSSPSTPWASRLVFCGGFGGAQRALGGALGRRGAASCAPRARPRLLSSPFASPPQPPAPPSTNPHSPTQAWTLIVNLKDTPAGVKIDNELIIGAARTGYDPQDPAKGVPPEAARLLNDNVIFPALENWAPNGELMRSINAISRHVTEEFSMFRFFLPQVGGWGVGGRGRAGGAGRVGAARGASQQRGGLRPRSETRPPCPAAARRAPPPPHTNRLPPYPAPPHPKRCGPATPSSTACPTSPTVWPPTRPSSTLVRLTGV
jgi:hypothetical protein